MAEGNSGRPPIVFSTDRLVANVSETLATWMRDPKNRRTVPVMLEKVGYLRVQNPNTDSRLWKIRGRRQAVYGTRLVSEKARLDAAMKLDDREGD